MLMRDKIKAVKRIDVLEYVQVVGRVLKSVCVLKICLPATTWETNL